MKLCDLKKGESATVTGLYNSPHVIKRLKEMGVSAGVRVKVTFIAPTGTPIAVKTDFFTLSVPRAEAERITVMP